MTLIAEIEVQDPNGAKTHVLQRSYYWGPDLSESVDGAGGAMGLVMIEDWNGGDSGSYFPAYDHSGNLVGLIDQGGNWDAWYEYDAYGNVVNKGGTYADENPIGFSTQYTDRETNLVYFGFRHYSPEMGRFITRDPIGEAGGLNLYRFVGNDPVNSVDRWGLINVSFHVEIGWVDDDWIPAPWWLWAYGYDAWIWGGGGGGPTFDPIEPVGIGAKMRGKELVNFSRDPANDGGLRQAILVAINDEATRLSQRTPSEIAIDVLKSHDIVAAPNDLIKIVFGKDILEGRDVGEVERGLLAAGVVLEVVGARGSRILGRVGSRVAKAGDEVVVTGKTVVYQAVDRNGRTIYVGITDDIVRRTGEHARGRGLRIDRIDGLDQLDRADARAVEQALVELHGLQKNGGALLNKINSIARKNPIYDQAIKRGKEILRLTGNLE